MIFLLQFLILCQVDFERFTEELDWEGGSSLPGQPIFAKSFVHPGGVSWPCDEFLTYLGITANNYDELMFFIPC